MNVGVYVCVCVECHKLYNHIICIYTGRIHYIYAIGDVFFFKIRSNRDAKFFVSKRFLCRPTNMLKIIFILESQWREKERERKKMDKS